MPQTFLHYKEADRDNGPDSRSFWLQLTKLAMKAPVTAVLPQRVRAPIDIVIAYRDVGDPTALYEAIALDWLAISKRLFNSALWSQSTSTIESLALGNELLSEAEIEVSEEGAWLTIHLTAEFMETVPVPAPEPEPEPVEFEGDITIESDDDIAAFAVAGYTLITGHLTITDSDTGAITSLAGLATLTTVTGTFDLYSNSALTTLTGLGALTSVGGDFYIGQNAALLNVTGLGALTTVTGQLALQNNSSMTSIAALAAVTTVGSLQLDGLPLVTDISAVYGITSAPDGIDIESTGVLDMSSAFPALTGSVLYIGIIDNEDVTTLAGAFPLAEPFNVPFDVNFVTTIDVINNDSLTTMAGAFASMDAFMDLVVRDNDALVDFGFDNLTALVFVPNVGQYGGALIIQNNASLTDLTSLAGLTTIGNDYTLVDNVSLVDVSALLNVDGGNNGVSFSAGTGGTVTITGNTSLPTIAEVGVVTADLTATGFTGSFVVSGNGPG